LQSLDGDLDRLHLLIYVDQEAGRCLAYSQKGKALAELQVAGGGPVERPRVRLINKKGTSD